MLIQITRIRGEFVSSNKMGEGRVQASLKYNQQEAWVGRLPIALGYLQWLVGWRGGGPARWSWENIELLADIPKPTSQYFTNASRHSGTRLPTTARFA